MHSIGLFICLSLVYQTTKVYCEYFPTSLYGNWVNTANDEHDRGAPLVVISNTRIQPFGYIKNGKFNALGNSMFILNSMDQENCKVCFTFKVIDVNLLKYKLGECVPMNTDCAATFMRKELYSLIRVGNGKRYPPSKAFPFWADYEFTWSVQDDVEGACRPMDASLRNGFRTGSRRLSSGGYDDSSDTGDNRLTRCDSPLKDSFILEKRRCNQKTKSMFDSVISIKCIATFEEMHKKRMLIKLTAKYNVFRCADYEILGDDVILKIFTDSQCSDTYDYETWTLKVISRDESAGLPKFMRKLIEWRSLDHGTSIRKRGNREYDYSDDSGSSFRFSVVSSAVSVNNHHLHFALARLVNGCSAQYRCLRLRHLHKFMAVIDSVTVPGDKVNCKHAAYTKDNGRMFTAVTKKATCDLSFAKGIYREVKPRRPLCVKSLKIGCSNNNSISVFDGCKVNNEFKCNLSWKTRTHYVIVGSFNDVKAMFAYKASRNKQNLQFSKMRYSKKSKNRYSFTGLFKYKEKSCSLDIRSILDWSNRDRSQTESDVRSSTTYSPPQTPYIDLTSTAKVTVKYQSLGGRTAKHPSSSSAAALATSYVLVTAVFYVTELLTSANL